MGTVSSYYTYSLSRVSVKDCRRHEQWLQITQIENFKISFTNVKVSAELPLVKALEEIL